MKWKEPKTQKITELKVDKYANYLCKTQSQIGQILNPEKYFWRCNRKNGRNYWWYVQRNWTWRYDKIFFWQIRKITWWRHETNKKVNLAETLNKTGSLKKRIGKALEKYGEATYWKKNNIDKSFMNQINRMANALFCLKFLFFIFEDKFRIIVDLLMCFHE